MELGLHGRRVLVTGATNGLGRAVAAAMVEEGALVLACGRQIELAPPGVTARLAVDVTAPRAAEIMVTAAVEELGGIDIVVAAAGRSTGGTVEENDDERWAAGLDLNLLSVVRLCRAAIPHLRESSAGRIVLFGAVSGIEPRAAHGISNIAKSGIHVLTKTLARELGPDEIMVNCIAPGRIRSGQTEHAFPDEAARRAHVVGLVPLGRFGEPEDVAPLTMLLSSPVNTYTTGQVIAVDGGMSWTP